ncbi:MAG: hypothetical protein ACI8RD_006703, partial [Bacillariaceae sp.]
CTVAKIILIQKKLFLYIAFPCQTTMTLLLLMSQVEDEIDKKYDH